MAPLSTRAAATFVIVLCGLLFASLPASAHLDGGSDDVVGSYLIDFGNSPAPLDATQPSFLNFNLLDNATQRAVNFTTAWVRISDAREVVFVGTFHGQDGNAGFKYLFAHAGRYDLLVRFSDATGVLVEKEYALDVKRGTGLLAPLVFLVVMLGGYLAVHRIVHA